MARRPCGDRAKRMIRFKRLIGFEATQRETLTQLCQGCATLGRRMDALTIHEAAETTGWSPRMLRYVERVGLVEPTRSPAGYRLYGPAELQRLRTLRELLAEHDIALSDLAFALRLRRDSGLREATSGWLDA